MAASENSALRRFRRGAIDALLRGAFLGGVICAGINPQFAVAVMSLLWCGVSVSHCRSCGLANKHVVYMLKVMNGDKQWICEKRYSGRWSTSAVVFVLFC